MLIDRQTTDRLERVGLQCQAFPNLKSLRRTRHVALGKEQMVSEPSFLICKIGRRARIRVRCVSHLFQVQNLKGHQISL